MKNMKKIIYLIALIFALGQSGVVNAQVLNKIEAYGVDTIAGYSSILSTSKTYPGVKVVFSVEKPDGSNFTLTGKTNENGVATVDVDEYHTKKAGRYYVSVRYESQSEYGARSYLDVFPDLVSLSVSDLKVDKGVVKSDGSDMAKITVKLTDQYENPIDGHHLYLISSRTGDLIKTIDNQYSNVNGEMSFSVSSVAEGLSVYSAYDVTEGKVLDKRVQIAFMDSYANTGGNLDSFIMKAYAESSGPINKFDISGLPLTISPNQNISFSVTAQDSNGLTVENYTGTVHFSAEGSNSINAILPEDYVFKPDDLGKHDFGLGLKFIQPGTYTISVSDVTNQLIKGEKLVTVSSSTSGSTSQISSGVSISTPTAGTYGQSQFSVSGVAPAGATLQVYDGTLQLTQIQAGSDGKFTYQTGELADGAHSLSVTALDASSTVIGQSAAVDIIVDRNAPKVEDFILDPSGEAEPGSIVNVKVYSEAGLLTAAVIFNADIYELNPSLENPSIYIGQVPMPADSGSFGFSVVLVDQLNNEATYDDVATITVKVGAIAQPDDDTTGTVVPDSVVDAEGLDGNLPPSQVIGVVAYGSDKRVTLVWEGAQDDGQISKYRIYYGLNPASMTSSVDTMDSKTTWYIPDLENGKEYYFSVFALDDQGMEGISGSQVASAIPFTLEVQSAITDRPTSQLAFGSDDAYLRGSAIEGRVPDELYQNGPEMLWLLLGSGVLSGLSRKLSRLKRK